MVHYCASCAVLSPSTPLLLVVKRERQRTARAGRLDVAETSVTRMPQRFAAAGSSHHRLDLFFAPRHPTGRARRRLARVLLVGDGTRPPAHAVGQITRTAQTRLVPRTFRTTTSAAHRHASPLASILPLCRVIAVARGVRPVYHACSLLGFRTRRQSLPSAACSFRLRIISRRA